MTSREEVRRGQVEKMWYADKASHSLGFVLEDIGAGGATVSLTVQEHHLNGFSIVHGGILFALADTAFALACNSHASPSVALQCGITFLKPARLNEKLTAQARPVSNGPRSGLYDVTVAVNGSSIAEFRGHSRVKLSTPQT